jgi:hypothetical protein
LQESSTASLPSMPALKETLRQEGSSWDDVSKGNPFDMVASVRQRLLNLSREKGEDFQVVLS